MIRSLTKKLLAIRTLNSSLLSFFVFILIAPSFAGGAVYRYEMNFDARYGTHTYGDPTVATHRHTVQYEQTAKYSDKWFGILGFRGEAEAAYGANPDRYANTDAAKYDSQSFILKDNYLQFRSGSIQMRAGYQQVVWGEAFGSYYADIVNPKDYREAGLGDLARNRLSSPMLNMQWIGGSSSVQLIYIPVSMPSLLPKNGSDFAAFTLPEAYANLQVVLENDPISKPTRGEGGLRITKQIFDLDFSVFYFNYYDRFPVFRLTDLSSPTVLRAAAEYMPLQTGGLTMTADLWGFLLRTEVLQHIKREINTLAPLGLSSTPSDELVYVVGLDMPPISKWQFSVQYSESKLLLEPETPSDTLPTWAFRETVQSLVTARIGKTFSNDLSIEALGTQFLSDKSTLLQAKVVVPLADQLELVVGADAFDGLATSQLGRYKGASRAWVMFKAIMKK